MHRSLQLLAAAASLFAFVWAGCSDDGVSTKTTSSSSSLGSTGTASSSATSSSSGAGGNPQVPSTCNPITNAGCDTAANSACDASNSNNNFVCFPPPNVQGVCEPCGSDALGWCTPSYTCVVGNGGYYCAKYCCNNNDCGPQGICQPAYAGYDLSVGVCMRDPNAGSGGAGPGGAGPGGAGGAGGAGGGVAPNPAEATHDCSPPDPSPSNGSCVTLQ